ncbi:MAG: hypothetical protein KDK36_19305, partial [Leptospiraceae bacterium]|nr:hypothetical protein [Leptospiraceae bacterium]
LSKKVKKFKNILIASSGSGIGISSSDLTSLDIPDDYTINVIGIVGENYKNIKFLGKIFQNEELLNNSDILVINGGHSSISEAICLQKPFIVIPIENHSEQYVNSQLVLKYGFGVVSKRHEINDKLNYLIKNYDRYFQNLKKYNLPLTGAEISVNFLYSYYMNSSLKHETIKIS